MAIPGLRGTEHIGFTVPDLDQAERFFVDVIGCEKIYALGPFAHESGDWMLEHLNVHPRTVMKELRFFRCKYGPNFEIFQYQAVDGQASEPRNSDIGGHHLAFYVDNFDLAYQYLQSEGIQFLGEPTLSRSHSQGQIWCYFFSPWGMQLELVSYPDGKAYEVNSQTKLWHPAHPEL